MEDLDFLSLNHTDSPNHIKLEHKHECSLKMGISGNNITFNKTIQNFKDSGWLIDKGGRKVIGRVLKDLGRIEGVNGSLVVGKDGLIIERDVSSDIDSELVGAMSSAVFGTAERSSEEMKHDKLQQVMIEGNKGKTLMIDSGEAILAVITDTTINLGLIRLEMKRSSGRIIELL